MAARCLFPAFLVFVLLVSGCFGHGSVPQSPPDLLSGRYRVLPREGKPLDEESRKLVLSISRSGDGWIIRGLGDVDERLDRIEGKDGNICARSGFVVVCFLSPEAPLKEGGLKKTRWILALLDRGVWNLERIE